MKTLVRNFRSPQSLRPVANQFIITSPNFLYFQSYDSLIARKNRRTGKITFDNYYWNYSRTTSKYRNQFTGLTTKETERAIKNKEIRLTNLN
jgi:hypothetical protein